MGKYINNKNTINKRIVITADAKIILISFFLCAGINVIIGWFPKAISVYPDELIYFEYAKNLFGGEGLLIHHAQSEYPIQKILYSLCILLAMLVKSVVWRIHIIGIINSILVASVVFPTYLLAKDIIKDRKQRLSVSLMALIFPMILNSLGFMSETSYLPIVVWGIYITWLFLKANDSKKKRAISIILGAIYYLAYLNKEVALYLLLAYAGVVFYSAIIEKSNFIDKLSYVIITGLSFLFMHLVVYTLFFRNLENGYVKSLMELSFSKEWILFFLFAFAINFIFLILSIGVFPIVILPFSKKEKGAEYFFSVFLFLSLVIACGVITFTITIREEFGAKVLRQHIRYVEPMMIPLFVQCIAILNNQEVLKTKNRKCCFTIIMLFLAVVFVFCVKGIGNGSAVDNTLLSCYTSVVRQVEKIAPIGIIFLNIGVCIAIAVLCAVLFNKPRFFTVIFICIMYFINICNCGIEYLERYRDYRVPNERIDEMQHLQNVINELDGNILFISSNRSQIDNRLVDSYISCENLYYTYIELAEEMGYLDDGVIDVPNEKIRCAWPYVNYEDLNEVAYILVNKDCIDRLDKSSLQSLDEFCGKNYMIYKNLTPGRIGIMQLFPNIVGKSSYITKDDNVFYTQCSTGNYISNTAGECVIYGPYCAVKEGKYKIELGYSNKNSEQHEVIGRVEIGDAEYQNLEEIELFSDQDVITVHNLELDQNYEHMEIRLWAYESDIQFDWVRVEKIQ